MSASAAPEVTGSRATALLAPGVDCDEIYDDYEPDRGLSAWIDSEMWKCDLCGGNNCGSQWTCLWCHLGNEEEERATNEDTEEQQTENSSLNETSSSEVAADCVLVEQASTYSDWEAVPPPPDVLSASTETETETSTEPSTDTETDTTTEEAETEAGAETETESKSETNTETDDERVCTICLASLCEGEICSCVAANSQWFCICSAANPHVASECLECGLLAGTYVCLSCGCNTSIYEDACSVCQA